MSAAARSATVVEELVEYDGPQLLLLQTNRNRYMLAMAIGEWEEMVSAFFGCELTDKVYEQYFDQRADLHYAFVRALGQSYYLFDLDRADDNGVVELNHVDPGDARNPNFWPEIGFFARSHTTRFNRPSAVGDTQVFRIDGKWGANDFSVFHAKMSDLYALFGVLARLEGEHSSEEQGFIRHTIKDRFWRGGGSYTGFYDSLMARNTLLRLTPLEVAAIKYASPGQIVKPGFTPHDDGEKSAVEKQSNGGNGGGGAGGGNDGGNNQHPFIAGLLKTLPQKDGAEWSKADQAKWLQAASLIFDLIYKSSDDGHVKIEYEPAKKP